MVESVDDLADVVRRARGRPAVVVYTLVEPELRAEMRTLCRRARLHYCDLLGQPIEAVAKVSGTAARMQAGGRHPLDETYFRRMEAIEFAVKYDDGIAGGLDDADIVLVGVSRTSKTPLSIYLGYLGYRAANVPIVKGIEPPKELFDVDPHKIVGLKIDAKRLAEIRKNRSRRMGGSNHRYSKLLEIYEELDSAAAVQRKLGCPVIDTTELSIEETAARVIRLVEQRQAEVKADSSGADYLPSATRDSRPSLESPSPSSRRARARRAPRLRISGRLVDEITRRIRRPTCSTRGRLSADWCRASGPLLRRALTSSRTSPSPG